MQYINSDRKKDETVSEYITKWLSRYYFSKIFNSHTIVADAKTQISGIDLYGDGVSYDIKAQASKKYLGNPTNTFIVEISTLNRVGEEIYGWFINPQMINDCYIFVWIPECKHNNGYILDIDKVECLIVDKHKLLSEVSDIYNSNVETDENSYQLSMRMRRNGIDNLWIGSLKFVCSQFLAEKPVNIVMKKNFLAKFAIRYDLVTKTSIENISQE